jgi:hypothetical protein
MTASTIAQPHEDCLILPRQKLNTRIVVKFNDPRSFISHAVPYLVAVLPVFLQINPVFPAILRALAALLLCFDVGKSSRLFS